MRGQSQFFDTFKQAASLAVERMPLHLVYELVLDCRPQSLFETYRRNEVRFRYVASHEIRVLAELSAQDECEQVVAFPVAVRKPIWEVEVSFPRHSEIPVYFKNEVVHVVGRLVAVVEKTEFSENRPPPIFINAKLVECRHVVERVPAL